MKQQFFIVVMAVVLVMLLTATKSEAGKKPFSEEEICKATIGALMAEPLGIMHANKAKDGYIISYRRPSDNTLWSYHCMTVNGQVLWSMLNGRHRNHRLDEQIFYRFEDNDQVLVIVIQYPDNTRVLKKFTKYSFKLR